ncbi:hypothetical protein Moror_3665 [Moniliophthora roreri MCA 2997]|uniref:Retrotransposon gag domain-containing protein n=1 Tax=Moniliophthora roreri (strain MCA 2997) TaxID=1381753 RepID=V2XT24_MONRO|nr:hypothetical protein Moror_3665 [Moniliophthora roreri MCA 2997]
MSNTSANQPSTDQLLQALVTSQTNLSNAVTQMVASFNQITASASALTSSDQKLFQKPSVFTGKLDGTNAHQFLAAFSLYAQSKRVALNRGFKLRFKMADEAADAKEQLHVLFQEKQLVAEYAAKFKKIMLRTGYSSADLHDHFYEHLAAHIKDELVYTDHKTDSLNQLINVANNLDVYIYQ